jgi:hypothetical protein
MKRLLALLALPLALALGSLTAGAATEPVGDPSTNPECADFFSGGGNYTTDLTTGQPTLFFQYQMEASTCSHFTYTLSVLDANQNQFSPPIAVIRSGNGTSAVESYQIAIPESNPQACTSSVWVYATVTAGPHVFDRAPTAGNFQVTYTDPITGTGCPPGISFG